MLAPNTVKSYGHVTGSPHAMPEHRPLPFPPSPPLKAQDDLINFFIYSFY